MTLEHMKPTQNARVTRKSTTTALPHSAPATVWPRRPEATHGR